MKKSRKGSKSGKTASVKARQTFPPVSQESLDWLSGLVKRDHQNPA